MAAKEGAFLENLLLTRDLFTPNLSRDLFTPHLRLKLLDVPFAYAQFGGGLIIRELALQSPPDGDFDE